MPWPIRKNRNTLEVEKFVPCPSGEVSIRVKQCEVVQTNAPDITVNTPTPKTLLMPLAATEYSYTLPAGSKRYKVKNFGNTLVEMAYSPFAGTPDTWPLETSEWDEELQINPNATLTLYFRSAVAGQEIRIRTWV